MNEHYSDKEAGVLSFGRAAFPEIQKGNTLRDDDSSDKDNSSSAEEESRKNILNFYIGGGSLFMFLLSFCDFSTLTALGSTCTDMRNYAINALKLEAKRALHSLPVESECRKANGSNRVHITEIRARVHVPTQTRWKEQAFSIVDEYICNHQFLRPLAYKLLREKACVTSKDFVDPEGEQIFEDEWEVSAQQIDAFRTADQWLERRGMVIRKYFQLPRKGGAEQYGKDHALLWHYALVLMYAAKPCSFRLSRLTYKNHRKDNPHFGVCVSLEFVACDQYIEFSHHSSHDLTEENRAFTDDYDMRCFEASDFSFARFLRSCCT